METAQTMTTRYAHALASAPPASTSSAGSAGTWSAWDGLLVLDARGSITFCNSAAAELLDKKSGQLIGQQVARLLPELPFVQHMPEFNLAYVLWHGAGGVWTRRALQTLDGRRVAVEVSLGGIEDIGCRSIVLILKQPAPPPSGDAPACARMAAASCGRDGFMLRKAKGERS